VSGADTVALPSPRARRRRLLRRRFLRRPVAVVSLVVILLFVAVAVFAPLVATHGPSETDFAPGAQLGPASWQHLFGTDELGRDVFSRIVWGARVSITVGILATLLSIAIAVPIGLLAGYYRGWFDAVVARVTDVLLAFPWLILAIALAAIMGPSLTTTTVALGVAAAPGLIRITRGETLALREADFVPAAVASGAGDSTIVFRHILPNMTSTLLVWATMRIPRAIIAEAALSFLGLGVRPPGASWGVMLSAAQSYLSQAPRLAIYPGLAIVLIALAFNLLGDALRDVLDPRTTR
jgi:ABC-type dipeptide/oligopeptide/nickel transport system permease subunit